jgi:hypothetical protein
MTDITWCAHENLKVSNSFFSLHSRVFVSVSVSIIDCPSVKMSRPMLYWYIGCNLGIYKVLAYHQYISSVLVSKNVLVRYDLRQYLPYTSKSLNLKPWNPSLVSEPWYTKFILVYTSTNKYKVLCLPHTRQKSASDLLTTSNRLVWQFWNVPNTSTCQVWKEKQKKTTHTMTSLVCSKVHTTSKTGPD